MFRKLFLPTIGIWLLYSLELIGAITLRSVSVPYITSCNTYSLQVISGFELRLMSSETFRRYNNLDFSLTAVLLNVRISTSDGPLWTRNKPSDYQNYKENFDYLNYVSFSSWHIYQVWVCVYFNYGLDELLISFTALSHFAKLCISKFCSH